MTEHLPRAFAESLARRDFGALAATLAPGVRFRALLPAGPVEESGPAAVVARYEGWFGQATELSVVSSQIDRLADRHAIAVVLRVDRPIDGGPTMVGQTAVCDVGPDGIEVIDLLCSGFRPIGGAQTGAEHLFDAGTLGCADGLGAEFRRRLRSVEVGDVLTVMTTDPSAKEDLPSLARMLGGTILSMETARDGRLAIKVERGK